MGRGGSAEAEGARGAVPVVDLSLPEREAAAVLRQACEGPGFFHVAGHAVSPALLARAFRETEALFALPSSELAKLRADRNNRGHTAVGEQRLDPARQTARGDTKEGFYLGVELPQDHPRAHLPLHGPNQWPPACLLPGFRPTMEEYFQACLATATLLLRLMALALGLPRDHFLQPGMFDQPIAALRPLHYSLEPSLPEEGLFGAGAHTDWGMFTLLATRDPGLQICRDPSASPQKWESIDALEGTLIVNIGDLLHRWTNGRWRSTLHRVLIPPHSPRDRYSIPFFLEPNFECVVEALPTCISPEDPPRWPPTTCGEHILGMMKRTHTSLDAQFKT